MTEPLLTEILATLKSIDAKLPEPPKPPTSPPSRIGEPGRVFSNGQHIPGDVDLVMAAGGLRWRRIMIDGEPSDLWTPRDSGGLELSSNDLLSRTGHVVEVPDPNGQEGT